MNHNPVNKDFKALLNFRDIGGVTASGGHKIMEGIVFRSANPDRLKRDDIEQLRLLNIRTIVDLRAPGEINKRFVSVGHAEKLSMPLDFQQTTRQRMKPVIYKKNSENIIAEISNTLYLEILDASAPVFRQVMEILASPDRSPVLIHCQAGKDRTGIMIALILLAMGVDREFIIRDFMKSNESLIPYFRKMFMVRKIISLGFFPYRNMLFAVTVKQRNIESVLDRIENHYGGIDGYLRYAGFDPAGLEEVRNVLLM
ncbi:MAG: tyrosine-protein phosphatase [Bacteroidales bacterium]|nr:tyrosine-protein phosphatase [Bacteroidales bacterium]